MRYSCIPSGRLLQCITNVSTKSMSFTIFGACFSLPSNQVILSPRILFSVNFCSLSEAVLPPLSCPSWKTPELCNCITSLKISSAFSSSKTLSMTLKYVSFKALHANLAMLSKSFLSGCGNFGFSLAGIVLRGGLQFGLWAFQCDFWQSLLQ